MISVFATDKDKKRQIRANLKGNKAFKDRLEGLFPKFQVKDY